jgi:hypothetical protein
MRQAARAFPRAAFDEPASGLFPGLNKGWRMLTMAGTRIIFHD